MMLEHYFFINRKRTNTTNEALDLFILEVLFIKIVEAIFHPNTTNHLPRSQVHDFTVRIKKETIIRIFTKFAYR